MDAIHPDINEVTVSQRARPPARIFRLPRRRQARDGRGRQPSRVLAEQDRQRVLEVSGGEAM